MKDITGRNYGHRNNVYAVSSSSNIISDKLSSLDVLKLERLLSVCKGVRRRIWWNYGHRNNVYAASCSSNIISDKLNCLHDR